MYLYLLLRKKEVFWQLLCQVKEGYKNEKDVKEKVKGLI
jgi:hypothetical protein